MKKILSILFVLSFALGAFAQSFPLTVTGSPVTNTGTATAVIKMAQSYTTVSIQPIITKTSGTVAGTVTLQGSVDGVNFVTVDTAFAASKRVTYTATNVTTNAPVFIIKNSPYLYYQVSYTGSGTMVATFTAITFPSVAK